MKNILFVLICALVMTSCQSGVTSIQNFSSKGITGSGNITSKEFNLDDYSKISIENSTNIVYEQKEGVSPYIRIETDDNLMAYYSAEVKNGVLTLKSTENVRSKHCKIYTNSTSLSEISVTGVANIDLKGKISSDDLVFQLSGVGNVNASDLEYNNITVNFAGVGNVTLGGSTQNAVFNIAGKGNIHAYELNTQSTTCNVSGVGGAEVFATQRLKASVNGIGNIRYKGNPAQKDLNKGGIGSIKAG